MGVRQAFEPSSIIYGAISSTASDIIILLCDRARLKDADSENCDDRISIDRTRVERQKLRQYERSRGQHTPLVHNSHITNK